MFIRTKTERKSKFGHMTMVGCCKLYVIYLNSFDKFTFSEDGLIKKKGEVEV